MHLRLFASLLSVLPVVACADPAETRSSLVTEVETCEAILQEFQASPKTAIPAKVLQQAKGLVIVNEFQAGFLIGGKGGYGVALVRRPGGGWSVPAFLDAGEASLGIQFGAKTVHTIFVLMDDAGSRLLYRARLNFGADVAAVAGPHASEPQEATAIIKASVLIYRMNSGLYAGAKLKTGWLSSDNKKNRLFYSTERTMPEILFSNWITAPAEVVPLVNYVQSLAGH